MKRFIAIACLLLPLALQAQKPATRAKIYGQIHTEQGPAEYVTVRLLAAADSSFVKGMTTDGAGKFEIAAFPYGDYLLSVNSIGYKTHVSKVLKITDASPELQVNNLVLKADAKMLSEVAVVGTVPFIEARADKMVVNVENSVVSAGASALEILQKAPGVIVDKDDNISLKGRSGVVVMIDGKPSYLSAADLGAMLRNMNASAISQMEIISSPSAKYDAAGNSGIINIKTKKNKNEGLNGSITAGGGYAKNALYNGGGNINYRSGKFNWYGNYNYGRNERFLGIGVDRTVAFNQHTTLFNQYGETNSRHDNNSAKVGLDYFINDNHTLGFMAGGFINTGDGTGLTTTLMMSNKNRPDSSLIVNTSEDKDYRNHSYNVNYRGTIRKGHELNIDLDYSQFRKTQNEYFNNRYFTAQGSDLKPLRLNRSNAPSTIDIMAAKADYTWTPAKGFKLEAGMKASLVNTDNDYRFEVQQNGSWLSDAGKTNYFVYDENINAAYLNLSRTYRKFTVQAGLRAEYTHSKGNSVTNNLIVDTTYTRLFPSVFVSHQLTEDQTIGFTFSQRIDRPGYEDLNPFLFLLDEYTYKEGNPYLRPQYTDSYELNYSYRSAFAFSTGFSRTKDVMVTLTEQDDATKTTRAMRRNMKTETTWYASLNGSMPFSSWWSSTGNLNAFYLAYEDTGLDAGKAAVQLSSTQNFTLPHGFRLEISGRYQSPLTYGIFDLAQQYQIDGGLQKSLFNRKGSLKLSVTDIFDMQKTSLSTTFRNMDLHINERYNTRQTRLTFTYRFGSAENKAAARRSGVEEETRRIKTGN
ncbi:MAG TPA: TonB-dependent receptor [Sphingobacteriaceae bacterium]